MKFTYEGVCGIQELSIDNLLAKKLDLMCDKVMIHKLDNLLIIDGKEGFGKSNMVSLIAAYVSYKTGRPVNNMSAKFMPEEYISFVSSTEGQIAWWDEAALAALAQESSSSVQKTLLKLLMVSRKRRHFYLFAIPKFYKLREDIVDRATGLVHVYSRDGVTRGRFAYYMTNPMLNMYYYWKKKRLIHGLYQRYWSFHGTFIEALPKVINEDFYDKRKDQAILSLGKIDKVNPVNDKLIAERDHARRVVMSLPGKTDAEKAKNLGMSLATYKRRKKELGIKSNGNDGISENDDLEDDINEDK